MNDQDLIPHLFRTEFTKITSVLGKLLGIDQIDVAEDIAGETFLSALETWTYKGIPENPTAWLYTVAKNKAKNYLHRNQLYTDKIVEQVRTNIVSSQEFDIDLSESNITDSQLQMIFAVCHPSISIEAQIGLALRILCGFGIDEIATALLTNKETINKRLFRAKEKLKEEKVKIEFPKEQDIAQRLDTVLTTLYLLFNEGYYSESKDSVLREDLCLEAMRLTYLLAENKLTNQPPVYALLSLMCFHASRFGARKNETGQIILYEDQDETLWNHDLISRGAYFLHQASQGDKISKYHLEAGIAYWHTIKEDSEEKWSNILHLFDQLLLIDHSPIVALNRIYALSKIKGKAEAIKEAEKLDLAGNHFYYTLLGELYSETNIQKAMFNFQKAYALAKSNTDKETIQKKINSLQLN